MNCSMNEIAALATKAARGAGLSWGLAGEAGFAVRWLAAHGLDGATPLASALTRFDGTAFEDFRPNVEADVWRASGPALHPIATGAALCDFAAGLGEVTLANVAYPVLLAPFAAQVAKLTGAPVAIEWDGVTFWTDGEDLSCTGLLDTALAERLSLRRIENIFGEPSLCTRAEVPQPAFATLSEFAQRTYAPATEESRLRGAGAGLNDND